jgi:transposase
MIGTMAKRPAQKASRQWKVRRQQAELMFEAGERQVVIAKALGISRQCVHNWFWQWQGGGRSRRRAGNAGSGRRSRLTSQQRAEIDSALRRGPRAFGFARERWTLWRVAAVIERITGIAYHPSSVWRILQSMGWTLGIAKAQRAADRQATRQWAAPPLPLAGDPQPAAGEI